MRNRTLFNNNWLFAPEKLDFDANDEQFSPVTIPHTNKIFPHHNFDNLEYQFISTYRKHFNFTPGEPGQQVFLEFDAVMLACSVYLNDQFLTEHLGGYIGFSVNLTQVLRPGKNTLTVYVDSRERPDIPPFGHLVDYLTFGGIYRDVHLLTVHPVYMDNLFIKPANVLNAPSLTCDVRIPNYSVRPTLRAHLVDDQGDELAQASSVVEQALTTINFPSLPAVQLWSPDQPVLYTVRVTLELDGQEIDQLSARFGFREARFDQDGGFYLNGKRLKLFGLDRHQTYPYIGAAAPARLQRLDADILKFELACNIVRTSHYPQSHYFLDRCDEIGLLVFEEITGWQHIGDEDWQAICLDELQAMIERDCNHPSIILWGVRINESADNDAFYTRTNALAHKLDPTRQTGGVRCFRESNLLEDVFTYNDFSNTVLEPNHTPYLITEFAGHMFPTKIWDQEERVLDHALLHAQIHNLQMGNPGIAGAIGWCAFDYATHIEFGSGDRICYHGVMDMFRQPKPAAWLYKSQVAPSRQVVLHAATRWTMGDRSAGGNNPLIIFSNCDEVEIHIGPFLVGRFKPDFETYPHLPHPPFTIRGLDQFSAWGQAKFYDLHVIGLIAGQPAAEHWVTSNRLPKKLELSLDAAELTADGADMTSLRFRITDDFGNPLPFATKVVSFELQGEADLIGENPFPLVGGQAALYVKARHKPGQVFIQAHAPGLPSAAVSLMIAAPES